jgi:dihydrofolate reductase
VLARSGEVPSVAAVGYVLGRGGLEVGRGYRGGLPLSAARARLPVVLKSQCSLACRGGVWNDSIMRRVVVSNMVSVDGFYAAADGNPLVLNMDEAFDKYNCTRIETADIVLLGRKSFEGFSSYWPGIATAPEDPGNRAVSEENRRVSRAYNTLPKVVVSDTFTVPAGNAWRSTTSVIPGWELPEWIRARQREGEGDILIFASRNLWNSLLDPGLVDEIHLMVGPDALAEGISVFMRPAALALLDIEQFSGSSNVLLRYQLRRKH